MIAFIVGMTEKGVIGKDNTLPWSITEDLQNFKKITSGHPIIMGRKTYESIGRPLPKRENIVVSRSIDDIAGVHVVDSIPEAIELAQTFDEDVYIIGGSGIFAGAMDVVEKMCISWIHQDYDGDVYFPKWDKHEWREVYREAFSEFDYVEYVRK